MYTINKNVFQYNIHALYVTTTSYVKLEVFIDLKPCWVRCNKNNHSKWFHLKIVINILRDTVSSTYFDYMHLIWWWLHSLFSVQCYLFYLFKNDNMIILLKDCYWGLVFDREMCLVCISSYTTWYTVRYFKTENSR